MMMVSTVIIWEQKQCVETVERLITIIHHIRQWDIMHQHQHIYIQNTVVRTHLSLYHHHHNAYIHQNNLQFIQRQRQPTLTAAADGIMNGSLKIFSKSKNLHLQLCAMIKIRTLERRWLSKWRQVNATTDTHPIAKASWHGRGFSSCTNTKLYFQSEPVCDKKRFSFDVACISHVCSLNDFC